MIDDGPQGPVGRIRMFNKGKKTEEEAAAVAPAAATDPVDQPSPGDAPRSKLDLALRVYGWALTILGVFSLLGTVFTLIVLPLALAMGVGLEATSSTLSTVLLWVQVVLMVLSTFFTLRLGKALRKLRRRNIALWSRRLVAIEVTQIVVAYMLGGFNTGVVGSLVQIAILISLSIRIDPTLRAEREEKREEEYESDMDAASRGMLGRDASGKGYLRLDFFNLFWIFFICCILGLVLEIIWHMTVVDPGVYEDRAGLLIGPFSPIYGFGAVLVTLALNRLYKNPVVTFVVSAIVGGGFEWFTALFMKLSFGVTAWDYSDYTIFGMPDPVAVISGGRTSTMFLVIWGILGLVWVKVFLPVMLKVVNVVPWKLRYGLTTVVAVLMMANGLLTLGSLDCWFERSSGVEPITPVEQFFAEYCNDDFMQNRFQSMTMHTEDATRLDTAQKALSE